MDPRVEMLTKREVELLHHVFLGRRTAEIAQIEKIANQTVLNRLQDARSKLGGVDRRTAALIVAAAKGWAPGIKPTPAKNTLFPEAATGPNAVASHEGWPANQGQNHLQSEGKVFVQTIFPNEPVPSPARRNQHDLLTRISMLLFRTALLVAAMVALLWVYGRV
jgi:DNA-binding CsgD family transcriptional regulator